MTAVIRIATTTVIRNAIFAVVFKIRKAMYAAAAKTTKNIAPAVRAPPDASI